MHRQPAHPRDLHSLPQDLPVPTDDGATDHLVGARVPAITLPGTDGSSHDVSDLGLRPTVFFFYPRTGRPEESVPEGWDAIPGARGCTPQGCAYRDRYEEFSALGVRVFGVSVQTTEYQTEFVERNRIPFPLLSDVERAWIDAARLPTFMFDGMTLSRRFTLFVEGGMIRKVFYPVFPSDKDAETVLIWLKRVM